MLETDLVVEMIFIFEICITWFIGRYKYGEYLADLKSIAKDYIRSGQLAFDILTSIPIGWLEFSQRRKLCDGRVFKDPSMDSYLNQDFDSTTGDISPVPLD